MYKLVLWFIRLEVLCFNFHHFLYKMNMVFGQTESIIITGVVVLFHIGTLCAQHIQFLLTKLKWPFYARPSFSSCLYLLFFFHILVWRLKTIRDVKNCWEEKCGLNGHMVCNWLMFIVENNTSAIIFISSMLYVLLNTTRSTFHTIIWPVWI